MIRKPIPRIARFALGLASVLILVGGYCWLSHRQRQINPKDTTIPNASQFVEGWKRMIPDTSFPTRPWNYEQRSGYIESSWLLSDLCATYGKLFLGIMMGVALSLLIGMAMGCFPIAESFFSPPLAFFAQIPPTAMLAVYFVVFGTGFNLFTAMIALGIFPTLTQAIFQAAKNDVTDHAIYKAYTLGASQMEVIWNVVFQQVLPRIIESVRLQVGPAMVFLIAAEWLVADVGFGYRLRIQSRLLHMNVVYIYLVILGLSGFVIDWILLAIRRWLCPWFGE